MISNHEVISLLRRTDLGDLSRYQARRLALKASVVGAVLMLAAPASAQFTVSGGVVFNNGSTITDSTTNSNPNAGSNSSSIQSFSSAGGIVGVNTNTGSILGNGFNLDASVGYTVTGSSVTMINNGNIQPSNNVNPALGLTTDGGTITYTGTGSVINVPANGNGIVANASGVFAGVGGAVSITAGGNVSGTEGIVASSNFAGTVTVQTSGNVTALESSTYLLPQYAIDVTTENGNAHVIVDSGTVTGGISSNATGNGNSIVTINGGTVTSVVNSAMVSQTLNGFSQVVINGGTLSGANGLAVVNAFTNFTGTGGVSVLMHGGEIDGVTNGSSVGINAVNATTSTTGVTVATDAGSKILMAAGTPSNPTTGIFAQSNGTAGGANVTVGGSISGADVGVNASITNTSNSNNAVVTVNGSIDANTTGVIATSNGTGNVQVNGAGSIGSTIHPSLLGVDASITNAASAGNVSVSVTGPITAGNGVQAFNAGSGSVLFRPER